MAEVQTEQAVVNTENIAQEILAHIEREREREIIARRFGLFDRKETLEQIGELLNITRERVRQLEKSVLARLQSSASEGELPHVTELQTSLVNELTELGSVARICDLSARLTSENSRTDQSRVAFLAKLCPQLVVIEDNDDYYQAVSIASVRDEKRIKADVTALVAAIKKVGEPTTIEEIASSIHTDATQAQALASVSKSLATLNGRWGLVKWSMVNPKNIRDKIYVVLKEHGKHMHFNEIAGAIKDSEFKRKDVTTQAIHNELIKDKRFVLIGRGIYALKEWGYQKGTVADIITEVLREAGEPLHRDEIVKRVLKSRFVKETTILLNLQGKTQFKRVAKATYSLAESE
ncbi:MAG TPA: sigma factor-like helix-turn-helix DNA-binding protein [Candidatus Saccharimonadales bacterium]|nr:sigma factor-like helix-turn-helix DNA-binding protein [Candidatus Saccharimonadales bacterium]